MNLTIKEALEHSGMKNVVDGGYWWRFEYNNKKCFASSHEDWNSWKTHYYLEIDGVKICTRCSYRTMIQKIKAL